MTTFRAEGNYIGGSVTIGEPYDSIAAIQAELAETRARAEEVLVMLIGSDGGGGLLGDMMVGLASAPGATINPTSIDTNVAIESSGLSIPTFNESSLLPFPSATQGVPTFNDDSLKVFPEDAYPVPTMAALPVIDTDIEAVDTPEDLSLSLSWMESILPDELFNALKAKIIADMAGGTGLSPAVEAAIYQRAKTRQQVDRLAEYDRINNSAADMQFAYPSGVLISALSGFSMGANRMDADIENTIIVSQGELAQKNVQNAMTQATALEQLLRQTRSEESQRALDKVKGFAELAIQNFSAQVQKFIGTWEGRKIRVQAQSESLRGVLESNKGLIDIFSKQYDSLKTRVDAVASYNKGIIDVFNGRIQAFGESERSVSSYNKGVIDVFTGRTQAFGEAERAVLGRNDYKIKLLAEQMKKADLDLRGQIAAADNLVQAYTAEQSIRERIVGGVSNIAAQVSASLLAAVHTSLGANYSASESADKSYRVSVGISESHEVPHDPAG